MPLSCAQKDLHLYHYSFGTKLFYCPCAINYDELSAFTQLVIISASCSGKAAILLLRRTSSIAFYQERSILWNLLIKFSFWVEFVILM
jgi:hypothetical protein